MPIDGKLIESVVARLGATDPLTDPFVLAADICRVVGEENRVAEAHDVVLRAMERRSEFGPATVVLDGLLRQIGLFPYLNPDSLSMADLLAYEAHRPPELGEGIVFHRAQAHVYHLLMDGENVALSAPTSFGKSLLIDAVIASGKYQNVVIVVPTLALIDETRRRLTVRFRDQYKVITRSSQPPHDRNIFILTAERVLEKEDWSEIDFFVIDEFYKLAPQRGDERSATLNQALYLLAKTGAQFYMLGPNIDGVTQQNHLRVELRFVSEPHFHTVATVVHRLTPTPDPFDGLVEICRMLDAPTMIFCSSPQRASEAARRLVAAGLGTETERCQRTSEWLNNTFHSEWHVGAALKRGIGVHHGRIPRSLGQLIVRFFNEGDVGLLICTSTLIEGVNTRARNIIVFDNTINREQIDLFTFNNIKGRSGRMFQYFVGHVYVFHSDPQTQLPFVDVPALSQSAATPDSLIVQMEEGDLTDESRRRRDVYVNQKDLSFDVIRQNRGTDPEMQLAAARRIANETEDFKRSLAWTGFPKYEQLLAVCSIIMDEFNGARLGGGSARTAPQLTAMVRSLGQRPTTRQLIEQQMRFTSTPDEAVARALDFVRTWAMFHFPRLLRAINNIQRDVLSRQNARSGSYEWYALQVESLFLDPSLTMLDEFGIPIDLARKLQSALATKGDLDEAIARLRTLDTGQWSLTDFERELVEDARSHL